MSLNPDLYEMLQIKLSGVGVGVGDVMGGGGGVWEGYIHMYIESLESVL